MTYPDQIQALLYLTRESKIISILNKILWKCLCQKFKSEKLFSFSILTEQRQFFFQTGKWQNFFHTFQDFVGTLSNGTKPKVFFVQFRCKIKGCFLCKARAWRNIGTYLWLILRFDLLRVLPKLLRRHARKDVPVTLSHIYANPTSLFQTQGSVV